MTQSSLGTKLVRVRFSRGKTGQIYATSPDLKGLVVGRSSYDELMVAIPKAIRDMYASYGERVLITTIDLDGDSEEYAWVVIPEDAARAGLEEGLNAS